MPASNRKQKQRILAQIQTAYKIFGALALTTAITEFLRSLLQLTGTLETITALLALSTIASGIILFLISLQVLNYNWSVPNNQR